MFGDLHQDEVSHDYVRPLIDLFKKCNTRDGYDMPPLHLACSLGHVRMV